jgi:Spy/CpxP family protein refolding chaperone
MKRFLVTLILGMSLQMAMAQDSAVLHKNRAEGHALKSRHQSWKQLNLSEAQKTKLQDLRRKHEKERLAVLTPEQREMLEKQKVERKLQLEKKSAARIEKLQKKLELTAEQKDKMVSINKEFQQKANVIRANEALAEANRRKQLKALVAEHKGNIKSLLTPEQLDRLKELKEKHQNRSAR